MNEEEQESLFDSLYPIGAERWVKVLIHDRDKCKKAFGWHNGNEVNNQGYSVNAIAIKDEYIPQLSAILDLEDSLNNFLISKLTDEDMKTVHHIIKQNKEELKQKVIFTGNGEITRHTT